MICQALRPYDPDCALEAATGPGVASAAYSEASDAAASVATLYSMGVGDSFSGTLSSAGDRDWVRVSLVAGQSYTISLTGAGATPVSDTYLRLYDSAGNQIGYDDDGGVGLNSMLTYTAGVTGTYYVEAAAYADSRTGGYTLGLAAGATGVPIYTAQQIADQLTTGYWQNSGQSVRSYDIAAGDVLTVDLSGLSAAGREHAQWALEAWTTLTGIRFNTAPAGGASIDITIDDDDSGAYAASTTSGTRVVSSFVNVDSNWLVSQGSGFNSYSMQTYMHEIGHALGLGHAGNYNGFANYGIDNDYLNDSWQATVMSYFDQSDNTYVNASYAYIATPMISDLLAMRDLYGSSGTLRTGNTVYGDNSTAGGTYSRLSTMRAAGTLGDEMAWTIVDDGGYDTLDLRSSGAAQTVRLAQGGISDVYGLVGNLSIAFGTLIERVYTGAGDDRIFGNGVDNRLFAGNGNDSLAGRDGNDSLYGEAGNDTLAGDGGNDMLSGGSGNDLLTDSSGLNSLYGGTGDDTIQGGTQADLIVGGGSGTNRLYGNNGNDNITAGTGGDFIAGGNGLDRITGGRGNDTIYAGAGDDIVGAGNGNDIVYGQAGNNRVWLGNGQDSFVGGAGNETINGTGTGRNTISGNAGNDLIQAGSSGDWMSGGAGNDTIYGGAGRDTIWGGGGNDLLSGGLNNDEIHAVAGNNTIYGGGGDDQIWAGTGADVMTGSVGADSFIFATGTVGLGSLRDTITDFTSGVDHIDLQGLGVTNFIDAAGFHGTAGEMRYDGGLLSVDQDGDGAADFAILLSAAPGLTSADFIL
ncbi:M10 family metallopeptidase C-terminal domain-containing protein [Phaeovulum sp. W22_SRMD_FR3]|uniref:M10 family metallopeptidase C-terminal domain-containing protein n=1 Tax=Phaeovulum sp. W22_SRMD_FR3 TaxID=3240274 RepID=UPI003F94571C